MSDRTLNEHHLQFLFAVVKGKPMALGHRIVSYYLMSLGLVMYDGVIAGFQGKECDKFTLTNQGEAFIKLLTEVEVPRKEKECKCCCKCHE